MTATAGRTISPQRGEMARLARDSGLNLAGMAVSQLAGMATVLVLARSLGDDGVGVYSQAFALRAMLMLICGVGTRVSMTHFVARYRVDGDAARVRGATRLGIGVTAALGSVAGLALVVFAETLANDLFDDPGLVTPIRLAGVSLPWFVLMTTALAATQGFSTMRAFAGISLIFEPSARLVLTVIAVAIGWGVGGAMWGVVIASVAAAALALRALHRYVATLGPGRPKYEPAELARFSAYSWLATIALQGLLWSDVVILGAFVSSAEVGVYQVATRVVLLGTMVTPALTASYGPRVAAAWRRSDHAALGDQYRALTGWTFRLSLPILTVITVFPKPILRVFGGGFEGGQAVIWCLVGGAVFETLSAPSGVTLNQANHNRANMGTNVFALLLNVALNVVLIPRYGIEGAAIAWAISIAVPGVLRIVVVRTLVTGCWPWSAAQTKATVAAIGAALVALGFRSMVAWPSLVELGVGVLVVLGIYLALVVALGPAQEDVQALHAVTSGIRNQWRR